MKPFNLEEYLKYPSKKVVTRSGRNVRIICTDRLTQGYPVVALWINEDYNGNTYEHINSYTINGRYDPCITYECDLFFADDPIPDFKPCDRVLTRGHNGLPWKANLFFNFKMQGNNTIAVCLKGDYLLSDIIPFDENKVGKIG